MSGEKGGTSARGTELFENIGGRVLRDPRITRMEDAAASVKERRLPTTKLPHALGSERKEALFNREIGDLWPSGSGKWLKEPGLRSRPFFMLLGSLVEAAVLVVSDRKAEGKLRIRHKKKESVKVLGGPCCFHDSKKGHDLYRSILEWNTIMLGT